MAMARPGRRIVIAACALLWLGGLAAYPLLESTEGRYASVARDMAHGGSWIEPHLNGHHLFTKPPLAYWGGAAALELLPDAEWAVRLPGTLMLLVCAALTLAAGLDRRRAVWAGLMALLSPLAVVQGHMSTGDIFLWAGILLAYLGLLDTHRGRTGRALLLALGLAVGFMAKGRMVLFWVVIPSLAWAAATRGVRRRPTLLLHPLTLAVFVGLAAPWFLAALLAAAGLPAVTGAWLRRRTTAWAATVLVPPFVAGAAGLGPKTREVVRWLDATGRPWVTYFAEPSSLEFYHRGWGSRWRTGSGPMGETGTTPTLKASWRPGRSF